MLNILLLLSLLPQQTGGLLDAVNSERGGRHWIDQKPDAPKTAEESLTCFEIEPGSRVELVASEPLVVDPVWIDFDHLGRMFVVEYTDYPIGPLKEDGTADEDADPLSQIVLLEDTDDDGKMDKRTVFADKLKFCHSLLPLMGGILAGAQTEIIFLKDTDGDNVADVREVWFDGFTPAHPQMQIGCPQWGMDNWIYLTYAPGKVRCRRPGFETEEPVTMPRQDMRFDPVTMAFESVSGTGQFGNTIDNDDNRFFSTNRNPVMMEIIPQSAATRNPFVSIGPRHADVGPSGGDTKVFPLVKMKSNYLSHAGTHTAACGVTAYRGDLWNDEFRHSVFVCEPIGHLVTRTVVETQQNSPLLTARRAREKADFLASRDTWFRPASLRTGPNGALYVADMYRMSVEHPKFLPPDIAKRIDWRAGEDKGRIWRIVPTTSHKPSHQFSNLTSASDVTTALKDESGWRRQTAHRLLVESQQKDQAEAVQAVLRDKNNSDHARAHALWVLEGIDSLSEDNLISQLNSPSEFVRTQAARIALNRTDLSSPLADAVLQLQNDSAAIQRLVALTCGAHASDEAAKALGSVAVANSESVWFKKLVLSSSKELSGGLLTQLVAHARTTKDVQQVPFGRFLSDLAGVVGARGVPEEIAETLKATAHHKGDSLWAQTAILTGLSRGLSRHRGSLKQKSLAALLADPLPQTADMTESVQQLLTESAECVIDASRSTEDRVAAIGLLSSQSSKTIANVVDEILTAGQPPAVQEAVIQAAGAAAVDTVLERWNTLGPSVRSRAVSMLLARTETTQRVLTLMKSGAISSSVVSIAQRLRLLQHGNKDVKAMAVDIFGGVVSANRKAVADKYRPAITMAASWERGEAVFQKTCSKCHKINGKGHNVGPDISDTRNRSRDALLYDILDPNRRVDPQFSEYVVVTIDGRTYNGLLVSDTAQQIVLRQPEGKDLTVARADIDEFQSTSKSLMPEGIEKEVSVQQMADLLQFLKGAKVATNPSPKSR